jgi:diaminopimelate decarboxylase
VRLINVGGGLGVDYEGGSDPFPLETYARELRERGGERELSWALEPGRWLVASSGILVARVRWVKQRAGRRFVVLAAGMNDFLRPALYAAKHRIEPVRVRPGPATPATVVGPVCESADVFCEDVLLPPLEPGDLVVIRDAGAYGAVMASTYNGRGRLAELTVRGDEVVLARERERPEDLLKGTRRHPL